VLIASGRGPDHADPDPVVQPASKVPSVKPVRATTLTRFAVSFKTTPRRGRGASLGTLREIATLKRIPLGSRVTVRCTKAMRAHRLSVATRWRT
jgi:hypothetical protein